MLSGEFESLLNCHGLLINRQQFLWGRAIC
jgi:hypothetical protein